VRYLERGEDERAYNSVEAATRGAEFDRDARWLASRWKMMMEDGEEGRVYDEAKDAVEGGLVE